MSDIEFDKLQEHIHRYIGMPDETCDCEPPCSPACCDSTMEDILTEKVEQQAARIAELERENEDRAARMLVDIDTIRTLEAERDAVRKALEWWCDAPTVSTFDGTSHDLYVGKFKVPHDALDGASIEAALLAAHREGEGK